MLTTETLRRMISYDPETGIIRRIRATAVTTAGAIAGYIDVNGYRCLDIAGRPYKAHRIAWFYVTGVWPNEYIDHINGVKSDNRFVNLRLATNSQNQANRGLARTNTSGVTGVRYQVDRRKWVAMITVNGHCQNLGRYATKEEAIAAYQTARNNAWGGYVRGADHAPTKLHRETGAGFIDHGELSAEFLRSILSYDPDKGTFRRLVSRQGHSRVGDVPGRAEWTGQRSIKIKGKRYREHHLAWLYVHGRMPVDELDHINGDPGDNRIANLREATSQQNKQNRRVQKRSTTGRKGVTFEHRQVRKYAARIKAPDGTHVHLGSYMTLADASAAYQAAAIKYFGEFAKPPPE